MGLTNSVVRGVALIGGIAALAASSALGADKETLSIEVLPGKPAFVYDRAHYDDACKFTAYPEYVVTTAPKKGTVSTKKVTFTIPDGDCKGKKARGLELDYTAKPGSSGSDTFTFHRLFNGDIRTTGKVNIKIR